MKFDGIVCGLFGIRSANNLPWQFVYSKTPYYDKKKPKNEKNQRKKTVNFGEFVFLNKKRNSNYQIKNPLLIWCQMPKKNYGKFQFV